MNYILGQLVWRGERYPRWEAPDIRRDRIIDLRNLTDCATAETPQGYVLIATERDPLPGEVLLCRFKETLKADTLDAVKDLLRIPEAINAATLPELVDRLLSIYSDPDLALICPPVMPDRRGVVRFKLGEIDHAYRCQTSGAKWNNILKVLHADYRETRREVMRRIARAEEIRASGNVAMEVPLVHRKLLHVWRDKFGVDNHEVFIPQDLPKEKPVRPTTTLRDTFNVGNHADIDGQASSDGLFTWNKFSSGALTGIRTDTTVYAEGQSINQRGHYRAQTDLSSTDHYVQCELRTENNAFTPALMLRKDSSATLTWYECQLGTGGDTLPILKIVAGTPTLLSDDAAGTLNTATFYTLKFSVNGSILQHYLGGSQVGTDLTDTAISSGLRCGMIVQGNDGSLRTGGFENFEAVDNLDATGEIVGLTDRLRYSLLASLSNTRRETAGLTDRLTYSLLETYSVTMREVLGMDDQLNCAAVTAILRTMREELGLNDGTFALGEQQDNTTAGSAGILILTHIEFDEGTEGYSGHRVTGAAHTHGAQVVNWGSLEKEVEIPAGPPRLSDVSLLFNDNPDPITGVQYWRSKFGAKTPRMRKGDILVGPVGGKEHLFQKPTKYTIQHATFPPGQVRIDGSDQRFRYLNKPIPGLINSTNFPNLPPGVTEAFAPLIWGSHSSVGLGDQGVIKLVHVDTLDHRYCVARHDVESVTVYRKATGETTFTEVSDSEYDLTFEGITINGITYTFFFVQFGADQDGAEIRADVEGLNNYGPWGLFPARTTVSNNAVDFTYSLLYHVQEFENSIVNYDVGSFAAVREKFEDLYVPEGGAAYAITTPLTVQEALTQLHSSFQMHLIPDNFDRLKLVMITDDDLEDAPEIDDLTGILVRSEMISLAMPTVNRYRYRHGYNPADGQFGAEETFENTADLEALGEVEELQVDFYSIRNEAVALKAIAERSRWESHEAHRFRFQLDLATNLHKIELLKPISASHYGGLEAGGWVDQLFIPNRVRHDLDGLKIEVDAIRRPIIALPTPQLHIGNWPWNHRGGPEYLLSRRRLYQVFRDNRGSDNKMVVLGSNSAGQMVPVDDGIFPALANVIRSSDSVWYGTKLYVLTQEEVTGRVGYSRFNGTTGLWEILNQTLIASNSDGDCGVTIAVQDPSGKPTAIFYGDREFSSGFAAVPAAGPAGDYRRAYISVLTGTTWSAPVMLGDPSVHSAASIWFPIWGDPYYNGAVHVNVGRAIRGANNRIHHVHSISEPGDVANTPDFYIQTLRTDGTLSAAFEWKFTGGSGNSTVFLCGDPCTITDTNGQLWIAVPVGELSEPKVVLWKDKDNPTIPDNIVLLAPAPVEIPPDTFGSRCPGIGVRSLDGILHVVHATRQTGTEEWAAYKTISEPFDTAEAVPDYTSGPRDIQCGARWPATTYGGHGFDIKNLTDGNQYIFKATGGTDGVPGVADVDHILERINVDDLPTDYTLADFVAANP